MKFSNTFLIGLVVLFFVLSFQAYQDAQPTKKSQRIYKEIKKYSPYYLEKRIGGFKIMKKGSKVAEKPPIEEVFHRLETLEQGWGKEHLKIKNNILIVLDDNKQQIAEIKFQTPLEKKWVETFYLLKTNTKK
jgi:GTPase involved in cell partitioning and DNA repair